MPNLTLDPEIHVKNKDLHKILEDVKSTAKKINSKNSLTKNKQILRELKESVNQAEELMAPKINILQNVTILRPNTHRDDDVLEENYENDLENEESQNEKWVPKPSDFCVPPNMNNIIVFDRNSKPGEVLIPGDIYVPEHYKQFEETPFKNEEYANRPVDENNVFIWGKETTNPPKSFESSQEGLKKFNKILAKFLNLSSDEEPSAVEVKSPILKETKNSNTLHIQEAAQVSDLSSDDEMLPIGKKRKSFRVKEAAQVSDLSSDDEMLPLGKKKKSFWTKENFLKKTKKFSEQKKRQSTPTVIPKNNIRLYDSVKCNKEESVTDGRLYNTLPVSEVSKLRKRRKLYDPNDYLSNCPDLNQ